MWTSASMYPQLVSQRPLPDGHPLASVQHGPPGPECSPLPLAVTACVVFHLSIPLSRTTRSRPGELCNGKLHTENFRKLKNSNSTALFFGLTCTIALFAAKIRSSSQKLESTPQNTRNRIETPRTQWEPSEQKKETLRWLFSAGNLPKFGIRIVESDHPELGYLQVLQNRVKLS